MNNNVDTTALANWLELFYNLTLSQNNIVHSDRTIYWYKITGPKPQIKTIHEIFTYILQASKQLTESTFGPLLKVFSDTTDSHIVLSDLLAVQIGAQIIQRTRQAVESCLLFAQSQPVLPPRREGNEDHRRAYAPGVQTAAPVAPAPAQDQDNPIAWIESAKTANYNIPIKFVLKSGKAFYLRRARDNKIYVLTPNQVVHNQCVTQNRNDKQSSRPYETGICVWNPKYPNQYNLQSFEQETLPLTAPYQGAAPQNGWCPAQNKYLFRHPDRYTEVEIKGGCFTKEDLSRLYEDKFIIKVMISGRPMVIHRDKNHYREETMGISRPLFVYRMESEEHFWNGPFNAPFILLSSDGKCLQADRKLVQIARCLPQEIQQFPAGYPPTSTLSALTPGNCIKLTLGGEPVVIFRRGLNSMLALQTVKQYDSLSSDRLMLSEEGRVLGMSCKDKANFSVLEQIADLLPRLTDEQFMYGADLKSWQALFDSYNKDYSCDVEANYFGVDKYQISGNIKKEYDVDDPEYIDKYEKQKEMYDRIANTKSLSVEDQYGLFLLRRSIENFTRTKKQKEAARKAGVDLVIRWNAHYAISPDTLTLGTNLGMHYSLWQVNPGLKEFEIAFVKSLYEIRSSSHPEYGDLITSMRTQHGGQSNKDILELVSRLFVDNNGKPTFDKCCQAITLYLQGKENVYRQAGAPAAGLSAHTQSFAAAIEARALLYYYLEKGSWEEKTIKQKDAAWESAVHCYYMEVVGFRPWRFNEGWTPPTRPPAFEGAPIVSYSEYKKLVG